MPTFYYIAVSNLSNQRTAGKVEADEEKAARKELNKMGLAVLSISTESLAESAEQTAANAVSETVLTSFEFEALDQNKQSMDGTIEAGSLEAALDRLTEEFHFEVSYLCEADADEATKAKARADGIAPILAARAARKEAAEEAHRKTFMGSIEHLMKKKDEAAVLEVGETKDPKLAATKEPAKEVTKTEQTDGQSAEPKKLKFKLEEKVVSKIESEEKLPVKPESKSIAQKIETKADLDLLSKKETPSLRAVAPAAELKSPKTGWNPELKLPDFNFGGFGNLFAKLKNFSPNKSDAAAHQPAESEIQAESRSSVATQFSTTKFGVFLDATRFWLLRRWSKISTAKKLDGVMREINRPAALARAWIYLADFLSVLACTYLAYFLLMLLALRYEWGALSELAHSTLTNTTLIPFLTLVLIFLRLLVAWRESLTQPTLPKTAAIFLVGSLVLLVGGVNLLY